MNRSLIACLLWGVVSLATNLGIHALSESWFSGSSLEAAALAEPVPAAVAYHSTVPALSVAPTPTVRTHTRYYPIVGETAIALRQQMSKLGPQSLVGGGHYDARTDWHVQWSYRHQQQGDRCILTAAQVEVDITYILPRWEAPDPSSPVLMQSWKRYMAALKLHEIGHKDHGVAAGTAALQAFAQIAPQTSCATLEQVTNLALRQATTRYNQEDINYDRQTRHGATQGAVFPND